MGFLRIINHASSADSGANGATMSAANRGTKGAPRAFVKILAEHGHGELNAQLSARLQETIMNLSAHAEENGIAKGGLTLALKIEVERSGSVKIRPEIVVKVPKGAVASQTFYVDADQNIVPNDPRQMDIGDVIKNGKPAEVRP